MSITVAVAGGGREVNMANGNAQTILGDLLGIAQVHEGSMDPRRFRDRCTVALAEPVLDSTITPPAAPADAGAARAIDCAAMPGVDNDYLRDRIHALIAVADEALRQGSEVVWS